MREADYYLDDECGYCVGAGYGSAYNSWGDPLPCDLCEGTGHKIDPIKYNAYIDEKFDRANPYSH